MQPHKAAGRSSAATPACACAGSLADSAQRQPSPDQRAASPSSCAVQCTTGDAASPLVTYAASAASRSAPCGSACMKPAPAPVRTTSQRSS
ncbi:hypothetical protein D3C71_1613590 [compost metagenome]